MDSFSFCNRYLQTGWQCRLDTAMVVANSMNVGDVVAQQYVERKGMDNHDTSRTMRMAVFGGCFAGPVLGNWYRFLELNVKGSTPIKGK